MLLNLPLELVFYIASYLNSKNTCRLCSTSVQFQLWQAEFLTGKITKQDKKRMIERDCLKALKKLVWKKQNYFDDLELIKSAEYGSLKVFKYLSNGLDYIHMLTIVTENIVSNGHIKLLLALTESGYKLIITERSYVLAIERGFIDIVRYLCLDSTNVTFQHEAFGFMNKSTLLHKRFIKNAITSRNLDMLKIFLVDLDPQEPIRTEWVEMAISSEAFEIVKYFYNLHPKCLISKQFLSILNTRNIDLLEWIADKIEIEANRNLLKNCLSTKNAIMAKWLILKHGIKKFVLPHKTMVVDADDIELLELLDRQRFFSNYAALAKRAVSHGSIHVVQWIAAKKDLYKVIIEASIAHDRLESFIWALDKHTLIKKKRICLDLYLDEVVQADAVSIYHWIRYRTNMAAELEDLCRTAVWGKYRILRLEYGYIREVYDQIKSYFPRMFQLALTEDDESMLEYIVRLAEINGEQIMYPNIKYFRTNCSKWILENKPEIINDVSHLSVYTIFSGEFLVPEECIHRMNLDFETKSLLILMGHVHRDTYPDYRPVLSLSKLDSVLCSAVISRKLNSLRWLLDNYSNVNSDLNQTPIDTALRTAHGANDVALYDWLVYKYMPSRYKKAVC